MNSNGGFLEPPSYRPVYRSQRFLRKLAYALTLSTTIYNGCESVVLFTLGR